MSSLGMLIREFQRDAAALATGELRTQIEINLEVLDVAIRDFGSIQPGAGTVDDQISATGDVVVAALMTALYLRELVTRPREIWTIASSVN